MPYLQITEIECLQVIQNVEPAGYPLISVPSHLIEAIKSLRLIGYVNTGLQNDQEPVVFLTDLGRERLSKQTSDDDQSGPAI